MPPKMTNTTATITTSTDGVLMTVPPYGYVRRISCRNPRTACINVRYPHSTGVRMGAPLFLTN